MEKIPLVSPVSVSTSTKTAKETAIERHVLVIDDGTRRSFSLDASAYSLGRGVSNSIVLHSSTVSRKHAVLLRLPLPGENRYRYRLIDGDAEGNPSANGIFVNQQRCSSHELVNGDTVSLGRNVQASYLTVTMAEAEFARYLQSMETNITAQPRAVSDRKALSSQNKQTEKEPTNQQPVNTVIHPQILDSKGTLIEGVTLKTGPRTEAPSLHLEQQWQRYRIGIIAASIVATTGLGLWWTIAKTQSQEQQSTSIAPVHI